MNKRTTRTLTVLGKTELSPHMLRLTLGGPGMSSFPDDQAGAYIKLILPSDGDKPIMRTYSVRAQRPDALEVDFALHPAEAGPASRWAVGCKVGDEIQVGGPGGVKRIGPTADWFLLASDLAGLPALSANLERLSASARGYAVIEIPSPDAELELPVPEGLELRWLVRGEVSLGDAVRARDWLPGRVSAWVACELSDMRQLRTYLRDERQVPKDDLYISSYWKRGITEEAHKVEKRADAEEDARRLAS